MILNTIGFAVELQEMGTSVERELTAGTIPERSAGVGCGNMSLLVTDTRKQRSSASYASLLGCMVGSGVWCGLGEKHSTIEWRCSEAFKKLLVKVPLEGGDPLLLCGFCGEGLSQVV